jgi:hypothetical protein
MTELYLTQTQEPQRGTLWRNPTTGRTYRITRTKWLGGLGHVHGTPATTADAMADLTDALKDLGRRILDTLPIR